MKKENRWQQSGFTLLELLVALGMFLIVVGAAFSLFSQEQPLYRQQQNLSRLNLSLRNAATQFQLDIVNAGTGFFTGVNIPNFPIGVTIVSNDPAASASCYDSTAHTYTATCFDALNVISTNTTTPPLHPTGLASSCADLTQTSLYALTNGADTPATDAAFFKNGNQLLLVKSDGSQMETVVLTHDGQTNGTKVQLTHNAVNADGTNTTSNDPLGISTHLNSKLGTSFCNTDWLLQLSPIKFSVDATDPTNPKLIRSVGGSTDILADQIIGFKVGATIWQGTADIDSATYNYDASQYGKPAEPAGYDYTLVRSVRISLIGRTAPNRDASDLFRNPFDNGPYQIQGISVIVNPRNLSMND